MKKQGWEAIKTVVAVISVIVAIVALIDNQKKENIISRLGEEAIEYVAELAGANALIRQYQRNEELNKIAMDSLLALKKEQNKISQYHAGQATRFKNLYDEAQKKLEDIPVIVADDDEHVRIFLRWSSEGFNTRDNDN